MLLGNNFTSAEFKLEASASFKVWLPGSIDWIEHSEGETKKKKNQLLSKINNNVKSLENRVLSYIYNYILWKVLLEGFSFIEKS